MYGSYIKKHKYLYCKSSQQVADLVNPGISSSALLGDLDLQEGLERRSADRAQPMLGQNFLGALEALRIIIAER